MAAAIGLALFAAVPPASAATPQATSATVTVLPADFGAVKSGQPVRVAVTVDDSFGEGLDAATATVTLDPTALPSRSALANWLSGTTNASIATRAVGKASVDPISAGASRVVEVTVPAAKLHLGAAGVYGIAVTVTSGGTSLAVARSALSWKTSDSHPVRLAIAAPLTVPASSSGFLSAKTLETDTAPDGILTRELGDLANTQVSIGIDPRIIASIRVLGKSAPQSARDWLVQLESVSNETFPLAWADADLTLGQQAGLRRVPRVEPLQFAIDPGQFQSAPSSSDTTPAPTPTATADPNNPILPVTNEDLTRFTYTMPQADWPAPNTVTSSDLTKFTAAGVKTLILSSANTRESASGNNLTSAVTIGPLAVAISDETLSGYLSDAAQSGSQDDSNSATVNLAAALDQLGVLSGATSPVMLATLPRNWADDGFQLDRALAAIYSRPWVTPITLSDVLAAPTVPTKIINKKQPASRIQLARQMLVNENRESRFSSIVQSPELLTSTRRLVLLSIFSSEWIDNPSGWTKAARSFVTVSKNTVNSVQVVQSSTVLFLGGSGAFPITIENRYSQPVTVFVTVRPTTPLLSVDPKYNDYKVTIDANSQAKRSIPVQSLSNGKVTVRVTLASAAGQPVGEAKSINVNVQAGWETIGTLVFGALVVAIFAFGIVRNIRKGRRGATASAAATPATPESE